MPECPKISNVTRRHVELCWGGAEDLYTCIGLSACLCVSAGVCVYVCVFLYQCVELSADSLWKEGETVEGEKLKRKPTRIISQQEKEKQGRSLATFNVSISFIFTVIWQLAGERLWQQI